VGGNRPEDRPQPAAPRILGEYEILERLGGGGMGNVYKALHTRLNRFVALKMLPESRHDDATANFRFDREMRAAGSLDHPNIVRASDAREIDGKRFLVMELVEGMDLAELGRRYGPLPIADACELIRQAALGLQSAHERGLVHRDVKPSNLMFTPQGQVKVLDLGLALFKVLPPAESDSTASGQAVGTAEYMAPEQVSDAHKVDIRADVYSLGCTLYKLLAGHAPFDGPQYRTQMSKMAAHLRDPIPPIRRERKEVPAALAAVLDKMLAKARAKRLATPGAVAAALAPFCTACDLPALLARARQGEAARAGIANTEELCSSALQSTGGAKHVLRGENAAGSNGPAPRGRWRRPAVLVSVLAAAAALIFLSVMLIRTRAGTVEIDVDPADAEVSVDGEKITVVMPSDKEKVEIQLKPGAHSLEVRHGGFATETRSFTLAAGGRQVLAVKLQASPVVNNRRPPPVEVVPHQNPLLPRIVFGEWVPLLPPPNQVLGWDRSTERARYSNRTLETRDNGWLPLLVAPNQLVGWEKPYGSVGYSNHTLETRNGGGIRYPITAKDARIRARAKGVSDWLALYLRHSDDGHYIAHFNSPGGRSFDIAKRYDRGTKFVVLAHGDAPRSYDDFFDFEFSAVGDTLMLSVDGQPLLLAHDSSHTTGTVGVGGNGLYRDVALFIPIKESLVADNRQLFGPFADPPAMDGLFTRLIRKEPDNVKLYEQRADLRARYLKKWPEAAEDLAKAIDLKLDDDVTPWHHRTMLLVKLQQKDLLAEHLAKMQAKFQDNSGTWGWLMHSLSMCPTGNQELIRATELVAGKSPNDPHSIFWVAIARYRAGKYEEADSLFTIAAAKSPVALTTGDGWPFAPAVFQAFHAMIKARLNDREAAADLLSKARASLKKAMLDDRGTAPGDYGANWWDRLSAEALLAEAESLITGAKPSPPAASAGLY